MKRVAGILFVVLMLLSILPLTTTSAQDTANTVSWVYYYNQAENAFFMESADGAQQITFAEGITRPQTFVVDGPTAGFSPSGQWFAWHEQYLTTDNNLINGSAHVVNVQNNTLFESLGIFERAYVTWHPNRDVLAVIGSLDAGEPEFDADNFYVPIESFTLVMAILDINTDNILHMTAIQGVFTDTDLGRYYVRWAENTALFTYVNSFTNDYESFDILLDDDNNILEAGVPTFEPDPVPFHEYPDGEGWTTDSALGGTENGFALVSRLLNAVNYVGEAERLYLYDYSTNSATRVLPTEDDTDTVFTTIGPSTWIQDDVAIVYSEHGIFEIDASGATPAVTLLTAEYQESSRLYPIADNRFYFLHYNGTDTITFYDRVALEAVNITVPPITYNENRRITLSDNMRYLANYGDGNEIIDLTTDERFTTWQADTSRTGAHGDISWQGAYGLVAETDDALFADARTSKVGVIDANNRTFRAITECPLMYVIPNSPCVGWVPANVALPQ